MEHHAADQLHVEMAHRLGILQVRRVDHAPARLAHDRERLRQEDQFNSRSASSRVKSLP